MLRKKRSRLLFCVIVTHDDESNFGRKWQAARRRALKEMGVEPDAGGGGSSVPELLYAALQPYSSPYNDLYGFIEIYWDGGTRILADSYFKGDGRRKAGKLLKAHHQGLGLTTSSFYVYSHMEELARWTRYTTPVELRRHVLSTFDGAQAMAQKLGGVAHFEEMRLIAAATDWSAAFNVKPK